MIAFVTVFLGLVLGHRSVDLVVSAGVARVELLLNGEPCAVLEAPPWQGSCDFGQALVPHLLEAVAYGAGGEELGRAHQGVNLPHDPAAASIVLTGEPGRRVARLTWESTVGADPRRITVTFDGRAVKVGDPRHIELPRHDPQQLHFLRAELDFGQQVTSVVELTFGGTFAEELTAEMTAVPIVLEGAKRDEPQVADLQGLIRRRGAALRVLAVEEGPAEIVVVVDRGFERTLNDMRRLGSTLAELRMMTALARDHRVRFQFATARQRAGVTASFETFFQSEPYTRNDGGFAILLLEALRRRLTGGPQRLADAVAVAGLTAASQRRRRAVVLVLGPVADDASRYEPSLVRDFLAALRVPIFVWAPHPDRSNAVEGWGEEVRNVLSMVQLQAAYGDLRRALDRQRVVWVDGIHLPQEIELAANSRGVRLAR